LINHVNKNVHYDIQRDYFKQVWKYKFIFLYLYQLKREVDEKETKF
jgi:hypothetical protein